MFKGLSSGSKFKKIFPTCFSDSARQVAISILLKRDRYMLCLNSLSSASSCELLKAVLMRFVLNKSSESKLWTDSENVKIV